jgi:hypothetical protein
METKKEETRNPTLFYKVFENTLNSIKTNLFSQKTESIPTPITTHISSFRTPLENMKNKKKISKLNKKMPLLKGTKFFYMLTRLNEEDIYVWI